MFRGITAVNLDAKGRMAMPARYRDALSINGNSQLVVTIDTDETCLLLYPAAEWEIIERKIEALPSFNKAARRVQRLLIGHATELELDAQGRILLPTLLREYAQLDKCVMVVGQGKKFEIWGDTVWNARRSNWLETDALTDTELPKELESISL